MLRFVILEHDYPVVHWDLMLEWAGVLRTWRLPQPPTDGDLRAEAIADHRLAYLDYEGPVSGDRGTVKRWDHGTYRLESSADDRLEIALFGIKVQGIARMTRLGETTWTMSPPHGRSI